MFTKITTHFFHTRFSLFYSIKWNKQHKQTKKKWLIGFRRKDKNNDNNDFKCNVLDCNVFRNAFFGIYLYMVQ